jgi:hypothetical protein
MKIRLQILFTPGEALVFEHRGPKVRIGRDPQGELVLQGEMSQSVSWNHAQVERKLTGARLSDLGSTNGTFVNDRRVTDSVAVKVGDQIQLGQTGPTLKVIELDLSAKPDYRASGSSANDVAGGPLPEIPPIRRSVPGRALRDADGPRKVDAGAIAETSATGSMWGTLDRPQRSMWLALVLGATCVLLLLVVLLRRAGQPAELSESAPPAGTSSPTLTPPKVSPPPPIAGPLDGLPPLPNLPPAEQREVGTYVSVAKEPPSVLLLRQREANLWGRMRPDSRIATGYSLVSLPGYRSRVHLDSGVQLTLWGNVPEFSNSPPLLESSVLLHAPDPGFDLDFTLDHGRVHLVPFKSQGEARVRVRFRQQIWELSLPRATEVVMDLGGFYPRGVPFSEEARGKGLGARLDLFSKGPARLKIAAQEYAWPDSSKLSWFNDGRAPIGPESLPKLPDWWTDQPSWQSAPEIAEMMLALKDLGDKLSWGDAILEKVLTQVREADDPASRTLGVVCLAALDAVPHLMDALEEHRHFEVRWAARQALQHWTSRHADHDVELFRLLQESKGYSRQNAAIVVQLLHTFSEKACDDPKTYEMLIEYLNHDRLAVRELASWHLTHLAPEIAKDLLYNPAGDSEHRKKMSAAWSQRIPKGTVPNRLPAAAK